MVRSSKRRVWLRSSYGTRANTARSASKGCPCSRCGLRQESSSDSGRDSAAFDWDRDRRVLVEIGLDGELSLQLAGLRWLPLDRDEMGLACRFRRLGREAVFLAFDGDDAERL